MVHKGVSWTQTYHSEEREANLPTNGAAPLVGEDWHHSNPPGNFLEVASGEQHDLTTSLSEATKSLFIPSTQVAVALAKL